MNLFFLSLFKIYDYMRTLNLLLTTLRIGPSASDPAHQNLGQFCQADFGPIWKPIWASDLRLSVDFPNRLSEIQIDRRKYLQIRPKSRYFFRSIWSRFGGRALREALLSTLDMAAASTPNQKRRLNHTATPRHPCSHIHHNGLYA